MGQSVTLQYGQTREGLLMMVVIRGENLTELYGALKQWKVERIAEFNAEDYEPPRMTVRPSSKASPFTRPVQRNRLLPPNAIERRARRQRTDGAAFAIRSAIQTVKKSACGVVFLKGLLYGEI
jgi:hypothetical protein